MASQNLSNNNNPPSQQQGAAADAGGGEDKQVVFEASPLPMREDYVQNAVKFLSHPKVRGSPVSYRRSFLEKKGLAKDEIDEAFRRVPDPQPSATTASPSQQANNPNQPTGVQPYTSVQSVQPATAPVTAGPIIVSTQPKFSWYHVFVAAGLLLGFGASVAVFVKKLFLPRLKSWIRKVVAEGDETEGKQLRSKIYEETAEAVKASASAVSAIANTNQELLASKDEGAVNTSWRASQQTNMYGVPNSDFGSGRPSFAPAPTEPTSGSFSRSYVETISTAQRGDRSSGSKPWETQQYSQQRLGYGSNSQLSDDGSYSEAQDNYGPSYHQNGKAPDFQAEEPRPLVYSSGVEERPPPQRRWVPPQPPGVFMAEASAAIRQPKSLPKQPSSDTSEAAGEMQVNGAASSSAVVAEVPVNGSAASDAGRSEIEEQSEAI